MTVGGKPGDLNEHLRRLMETDRATLPPDGGVRFNRLIFATSPYLLQHAENPVDWYPWGEEAFVRAREEDRPVFLSIGYATCHWCHVMEAESFENPEVAQVLNRHYVAIKVDREERPDIDEHFMTAAQLMTGSGGWPLNIVMTPDQKPFFAATYLPVEPRSGMPGIIQVLEKLAELWRTERGKLTEHGANVVTALVRQLTPAPGGLPEERIFLEGSEQLASMYDPEWGGFGSAPKFPMPGYLMFLLRTWKRSGVRAPLAMAEQTLRMLRFGGIYDQLGFGVHRYAVDREWLVPHFEKMLYDQALIATAALETFRATGDRFFRTMAEEIFTFVLREMTAPAGGFYSGLDADSEGEEGKYYLWTPDEIRQILGEEGAGFVCRLFDVSARGNFEGANVLHLTLSPETFAAREGIPPELMVADLARWRELLLAARERRIRPFRDEKVLTAWNGLMIAAFAEGFAVTGEERFRAAAVRGVQFIREHLLTPEGRLLRSYHRGEGSIPAFAEDYAFLVRGLLGLYEATLDREYLDEARRFTADMLRLFGDSNGGGLFDAGSDSGEPLLRMKSADDGVIPSANSVAALNLLELGRILGDAGLVAEGERLLRAFMGDVAKHPAAHLQLLSAYDYLLGPAVEITLVGRQDAVATANMLHAIGRRFIPGLVLRHTEGGEGELQMLDDTTTAYLCAAGACRPPVADVGELAKLLDVSG